MQSATDEAEFDNAIEAMEATAAIAGIYGRAKLCDY
jgi:hypothetical protein